MENNAFNNKKKKSRRKAEEKRCREQKVVLALTTGMCELYFRLWREQEKRPQLAALSWLSHKVLKVIDCYFK